MRPLVCHPKFTNMILVMMCLLSLHLVAVSAQACEFPPYYDNGGYYTYAWSWDPGHDVQVYVDNNYQDPDRNQIVKGIFNWNSCVSWTARTSILSAVKANSSPTITTQTSTQYLITPIIGNNT